MTTVASPAMQKFAADWEAAIDSASKRGDAATISGIVGDTDHRRDGGYHISREDQPATNYSVVLPEDKGGSSAWASAVDMSMRPEQMALVTGRLLASAKDVTDSRLNYCREFYGTLNGRDVVGWDTYYGTPATSDDSHLWHVHISFLRKFANDPAAMAAVLSVITGTGVPIVATGDEDFAPYGRPNGGGGRNVGTYSADVWGQEISGKSPYDGTPSMRTKQLARIEEGIKGLIARDAAGGPLTEADIAAMTERLAAGITATAVAAEIIRQLSA